MARGWTSARYSMSTTERYRFHFVMSSTSILADNFIYTDGNKTLHTINSKSLKWLPWKTELWKWNRRSDILQSWGLFFYSLGTAYIHFTYVHTYKYSCTKCIVLCIYGRIRHHLYMIRSEGLESREYISIHYIHIYK